MPAPTLLSSLVVVVLLSGCARPMSSSSTEPLPGTLWRAESIDERGVIDFLQSTITFDAAGGVAGNAGCNQFFGEYETDGTALSIGPLGMTKRMCAPAVMDQETKFTAALERATRYAVSAEGFLLLYDAEGEEVLHLAPSDEVEANSE